MKLPIYYLPPVEWFKEFVKSTVESSQQNYTGNAAEQQSSGHTIDVLDYDEVYQKQSLRNHCFIDSPQGKLKLTVPVEKVTPGMLMKDVRISEHGDWQHKHWHAIETTYYNSPFFEYMQDDFRALYEKKFEFLVDFNVELINLCSLWMGIDDIKSTVRSFQQTDKDYVAKQQSTEVLIQNSKTQKLKNIKTQSPTYYQVFAHKHGFLPDLSVVDLLFNMGKESILMLF